MILEVEKIVKKYHKLLPKYSQISFDFRDFDEKDNLEQGFIDAKYGNWVNKPKKLILCSGIFNIDKLDINYDDGYGTQEIFGFISFKDGTWMERGEYDGSEWWDYKKCPTVEDYNV